MTKIKVLIDDYSFFYNHQSIRNKADDAGIVVSKIHLIRDLFYSKGCNSPLLYFKIACRVLRTEIHQIGNHINQIARSVNAGIEKPADAKRGLLLLDKVYELMYQLANR